MKNDQVENLQEQPRSTAVPVGREARAPLVFISYSHDSPAHKKWVGELASKLMENGVEVILDQWGLGLGDDAPKFMEKGVGTADCVLMICTEAYVRKADDGKGGAGYEAMIVTGELVANLGTAKFVPVIRQEYGTKLVPKCVGTRIFADLSPGQNFDEQFEALLRKIHRVPKFKKPPLGKNPFASEAATDSAAPLSTGGAVGPAGDPAAEFYQRASNIAHRGDLLEWRRVLKQVRQETWKRLGAWRKKYEAALPRTHTDLPPMASEGFRAVAPLVAMALAGVESGQEKFRSQIGIVDELLAPPQWSTAGYPIIADFPDALVFTYQALHGAISMETGQLALAAQLARSHFQRPRLDRKEVLFEEAAWVGWLGSMSDSCTTAWRFLCDLPAAHAWLMEMFGSKEDYLASLSAYYAVLSIMELSDIIARGRADVLKRPDLRVGVPLCGFSIPRELAPRAFRTLTRDAAELRRVWEGIGVSTEALAAPWPAWMAICKNWLQNVYPYSTFGPRLYHEHLFEEPGLAPARPDIGALVG